MASITIRNLDDDIKQRLRVQAAMHGRSMEAEAREVLLQNLKKHKAGKKAKPMSLLEAIRGPMEKVGFVDLPPVKRGPMRPPPFQDDDE